MTEFPISEFVCFHYYKLSDGYGQSRTVWRWQPGLDNGHPLYAAGHLNAEQVAEFDRVVEVAQLPEWVKDRVKFLDNFVMLTDMRTSNLAPLEGAEGCLAEQSAVEVDQLEYDAYYAALAGGN
jgi:hypothetical protein